MSTGAYAADKAAFHQDRLKILREHGHPYPVHLQLIVSDLCNLDCPTCAYRLSGYSSNELFPGPGGERNPQRFLEMPLIEQVLFDCAAMGVKAIEITGGGEPTVHPDIVRIMDLVLGYKLQMALVTNGLLLGRNGLIDAAVRAEWTRISIDAATEQTYGTVRPSLGSPKGENLRLVLRNLEWLRETRDTLKTNCVIGAGFVVQKENWHEIYEAARIYREYGADNIRISGAFTPEGDAYHDGYREAALELEQKAVDLLSRDGFKVYGRFREKMSDLLHRPEYSRCAYQRFTTILGGDGNLYRCCVVSYSKLGMLGSVREAGGLKRLWESEEVRKKLDEFDARHCTRCQHNDKNRAMNSLIDADVLPPAPDGIIHPHFV